MDEWEHRKSVKQNKKYNTGHTYRRVSNRDVIRLNKDQNIKTNDEIEKFGPSYKGISVNKNKNWLLKDKLLSTTNDEVFFDKEPKVERKKKANSKKFEEIPVWDHLEPIVKVEKDHLNNKLLHNYVFYNPQSQKINQEEDETTVKKKQKALSRKAQRNLSMKKLDEKDEKSYEETIKYSIEAPFETLKQGKCWKHGLKVWKPTSTFYTDDNKYSPAHFCEVISTSKHNTQKKQLALDDPKCIAKDYLKYDQMKHARTAISYLSHHVNDGITRFKPLIGLESYVDREEVVKNFTKEFHNVTANPLMENEEDGFYVCSSSDWQEEPITVCQICLEDSKENLIKLDGCQHEACRNCWRHYVRSMIKTFDLYSKSNLNKQSIISCLHQDCSNSLTMDLITKILSPFEIKKYIKFYCDFKILNNQSFVECKRENCKRLILKSENSEISVCKCNYMICNKCDLEAHYPISCENAMLYNTFYNSNDKDARFFMQGKFCPKCHMFIEKDGGCEHMHCFCQYDFCWECLRDYERGHLCRPGSKVRLATLSMFSMDKIIKSQLINVINSIGNIQLDSQKRLTAADMIYTKLRLHPIDTNKIRFGCDDENDTDLQVNLSNIEQQGLLELIYFFLKKISNDIEQFNTICKYAAFEGIVKKNDNISVHVYTAVQLCEAINKMFLKVENWKQLNQLFTAYRKLMNVRSKINIPTQF